MARRAAVLVAVGAAVVLALAAGNGWVDDAVARLAEWEAWRAGAVIHDDGIVEPKIGYCNPVGTWYGANGMGDEFVMTIVAIGDGRYLVESDGLYQHADGRSQRSILRGEILATAQDSYRLNQIGIIPEPDALTNPDDASAKARPMLVGMSGDIFLHDCVTMEVGFDAIGLYVWGAQPFVDRPVVTYPPCCGHFRRMLNDLY